MKDKTASLENHFASFADNIIGNDQSVPSSLGEHAILYADWTATGRAYQPIETFIEQQVLPFIGNTHTTGSHTGKLMSGAYAKSKQIVKQHVHANDGDALIFCGSGMTHAVNKLQRILGLRAQEQVNAATKDERCISTDEQLVPVVFVTHMEHHSNHTSWLETIATVEIIPPGADGNVDLSALKILLLQYKHRKLKIAAVTACSNVTGIETAYHEIARLMHIAGGYCFVDFACSAPYVQIDMHPPEKSDTLDAIYFSGHKFLGGVGTPGVLIFNKLLYNNSVPDQPGGGTILYSNPWKIHEYLADIEEREDGGTPCFYGAIKFGMCIRLKETMGVNNMLEREREIMEIIFNRFGLIKNAIVLEGNCRQRLGVISFIVRGMHHDLFVKILSDRFGVQARSGCSCAGTYGHYLLGVGKKQSYRVLHSLLHGELLSKPGWVRLSVHPTMSDEVVHRLMDAVQHTILHFHDWAKGYVYNHATNEFSLAGGEQTSQAIMEEWFYPSNWQGMEASTI